MSAEDDKDKAPRSARIARREAEFKSVRILPVPGTVLPVRQSHLPLARSALLQTLAEVEQALKLNPDLSVMDDRAAELGAYLGTSSDRVKALYEEFHVNKTKRPPKFDGTNHETIVASISDPVRVQAHMSRMMLHYSRYQRAFRVVRTFSNVLDADKRKNLRILDYGCGVADYGLVFALFGYDVLICDIDSPKLDFAKERFKYRGLKVQAVPIDGTTKYPDFSQTDAVVTAELLEHLANPLEALEHIHIGLPKDGLLWFSDFPMAEKSVGGEHTESAAALRESCVAYLEKNFVRLADEQKYLYRNGG